MALIAAAGLTKYYGKTRGIEDLTFSVDEGEVFGFLGPNGAGKTTTIRCLLDFIRPTRGGVTIFGLDPRRDGPRVHARIGYLPGELALYERLTGERYLDDFATFRGGVPRDRYASLAERLGLDITKHIRDLSHGNKQKVGLVQAFMHRPDLLILDEPTQGLDPLVQQVFYAMLDEERGRGATVFLSSHVMPEVERVCDGSGSCARVAWRPCRMWATSRRTRGVGSGSISTDPRPRRPSRPSRACATCGATGTSSRSPSRDRWTR